MFGAFRRGASLNLWRLKSSLDITEADARSIPRSSSIRPRHQRCLARCKPSRKASGRRSIRAAPTPSPSFAHTVNYRESDGLFASSGILFNHESPLRGIGIGHAKDHLWTCAYSRGGHDSGVINLQDAIEQQFQ